MDTQHPRPDLPVLLLHNLDRQWPVDAISEALDLTNRLSQALLEIGHPTEMVCVEGDDLTHLLNEHRPDQYIVFNWCEEIPSLPRSAAQVAAQLEDLGFVFTGADSKALALSQDKRQIKQCLIGKQIATPRWEIYERPHPNGWEGFPAIVKPVFEHCSYGITHESVVFDACHLRQRVEYVLDTFHQPALVEDFIDGREFHVSVIGNGRLRVLPAAEMDFSAFTEPSGRLCTYDSKFDPQSSDYQLIGLKLPAPLSGEEQNRLEATAIAAYRAASCRDYARMDIRLRDGIFYVLDVNPNADLSPDTSLALAAEVAGLPYGQLGSLLVNLAAQRSPKFDQKGSIR